ncbi:MAG: hypothetical protein GZ094_00580 [Mariniphaga sp.]|nr:hypothetical protein [Mariniphaga sp.]
MKTEYYIRKGQLLFSDHAIEIRDKSKNARNITYLFIFILICCVILYFTTGSGFFEGFGSALSIGIIIRLIPGYKQVYDKHIPFNTIEKVVIQKNLENVLEAVFFLMNGKRRKVILEFDRYSLSDFEISLKENSILTEIK